MWPIRLNYNVDRDGTQSAKAKKIQDCLQYLCPHVGLESAPNGELKEVSLFTSPRGEPYYECMQCRYIVTNKKNELYVTDKMIAEGSGAISKRQRKFDKKAKRYKYISRASTGKY